MVTQWQRTRDRAKTTSTAGCRYIDDILAEITRFHAAKGAHRITATTDMTNLPMAAAFERAGYRNYEVRLILSAPADRSG